MLKRHTISRLFITVSLLLTLNISTALAANIPGSAEPARLDEQIKKIEPKKAIEAPAKAARPPVVVAPEGAEKITFVLNKIKINGATTYTDKELSLLYKSLIGKEISLAAIYELADKITVKYRNDGYILSQAIIPPQTIDNGEITINIIEGFVDKITIKGKDNKDYSWIKPYTKIIKQSAPLNNRVLERALLLINDLPGITAKSVLSASAETTGASDLDIIIAYKHYNISLDANNRGSRYIGPEQLSSTFGYNNLAGGGESLNIQLSSSPKNNPHRQMDNVFFNFNKPLGANGTILNLNSSITSTEPGYTLKPLAVTGISHKYNIEISKPVIRSRSKNLYASIKLNYIDTSNSDNLGLGKTLDKLRVLRLGATYQFSDKYNGFSGLNLEASKGLNIFNIKKQGTANMSRARGNPEFFKVKAELSRSQSLTNQLAIFTGLNGQWSASSLLSSEEFGIGGANYGSAYDSSEITGKNGIAARVELRSYNPVTTSLEFIQLYGFYDIGKTWDPQNAAVKERINSIASAGLGIRTLINKNFSASIEGALPLTRKVATQNNNGARIFFSLNANF